MPNPTPILDPATGKYMRNGKEYGGYNDDYFKKTGQKIPTAALTPEQLSSAKIKVSPLQTSTSQRLETQTRLTDHQTTMAKLNAKNMVGSQPAGTVSITQDRANPDGTRQVTYSDGKTATVKVTKNPDGTESYSEIGSTGGATLNNDEDPYGFGQQLTGLTDDRRAQIKEVTDGFDRLAGQFDSATDSLIASIKQKYAGRIADMAKSNQEVLATKGQLGVRQGRARYAPTLNQQILSDEEQMGTERIAKLEGDMMSLIAEAEVARAERDYKSFNAKYDQLEKVYTDMRQAIIDQHNMAVQYEDRRRQAKAEDRLAKKQELDNMLSLSERAAPALVTSLEKFKNPTEKQAFLKAYADKTGIDLDVLLGDVEAALSKQGKEALDMANIRNQIYNRNRAEDRAEGPQPADRTLVKRYLARKGSDTDRKKAEEDETFFYYILDLAKKEEEAGSIE